MEQNSYDEQGQVVLNGVNIVESEPSVKPQTDAGAEADGNQGRVESEAVKDTGDRSDAQQQHQQDIAEQLAIELQENSHNAQDSNLEMGNVEISGTQEDKEGDDEQPQKIISEDSTFTVNRIEYHTEKTGRPELTDSERQILLAALAESVSPSPSQLPDLSTDDPRSIDRGPLVVEGGEPPEGDGDSKKGGAEEMECREDQIIVEKMEYKPEDEIVKTDPFAEEVDLGDLTDAEATAILAEMNAAENAQKPGDGIQETDKPPENEPMAAAAADSKQPEDEEKEEQKEKLGEGSSQTSEKVDEQQPPGEQPEATATCSSLDTTQESLGSLEEGEGDSQNLTAESSGKTDEDSPKKSKKRGKAFLPRIRLPKLGGKKTPKSSEEQEEKASQKTPKHKKKSKKDGKGKESKGSSHIEEVKQNGGGEEPDTAKEQIASRELDSGIQSPTSSEGSQPEKSPIDSPTGSQPEKPPSDSPTTPVKPENGRHILTETTTKKEQLPVNSSPQSNDAAELKDRAKTLDVRRSAPMPIITSTPKSYTLKGVSDYDAAIASHSSPTTPTSVPISPGKQHSVVVAIDFGTTFSGYAFGFSGAGDSSASIHVMRRWEGGDPGVNNQKTLTTLLLTPEGEFHSFGFSARDFYHDMDFSDAKKWLYFEKFKMALHTSSELNNKTMLEAMNGTKVSALDVFAHSLRYFKEHALLELNDMSEFDVTASDIRWVITVPAIWKQPAKQFMREASYKAGIGSFNSPEQLLIALEPEAASIYMRKLRLRELIPEPDFTLKRRSGSHLSPNPVGPVDLKNGTKYMVVDCGGGTVDITVHEVEQNEGTLKELHKATGGEFGSVTVDKAFEELLNEIFGAEFIDEFKTIRPAGWVDLMIAFEARKRNVSPWKNNPLNVSLPFSFIDYYKKYTKGESVESAVRKYSEKDKEIKWSQQVPGMLRFTPDGMRKLFNRTINKIIQQIQEILDRSDIVNVSYLFLVGGFAESPILQSEIRKSFSSQLRVIIPQDVGLSILKGAVLFGLDPTVVRVRRSRLTYGVGVLNKFEPGKHPKEKLIIKEGIHWCSDVFDTFVMCDQPIAVGDAATRSYAPAKANQKSSIINIYCSEKQNVSYITDEGVKRCGTLHIDMSDSTYVCIPRRREIQLTMMFGDTEIKVNALDVPTGKCVKASIDFLNK